MDPRATDFVPQMLDIVGRLQNKGLAYQRQWVEMLLCRAAVCWLRQVVGQDAR